jgi:ABC-type glycerol-3-phosphate transport system substrate-binding protein
MHGMVTAGVAGQLVKAFLARYWSLGDPLLTEDWVPLVNGPNGVEALEMLKYEFENFGPEGILGFQNPDAATLFANGDSVSYQNWPTWIMPKILDDEFPEVNVNNIGIIPFFNGGSGNLTNHALMIFEKSPNKDAAFEWIMYVASPENSKDMFLNYGVDVPRKSIYSDPEVLEKMPFMADFLTAVEGAKPIFLGVPYWLEMFLSIGQNTSKYMAGEVSAQSAVDQMADTWSELIEGNPMTFPYKEYKGGEF